ncbi:hypothetical protein F4778DRAFT_575582 [Xylariomycetidae sp. FL2044]|nr:hypothetical protein F4778DRAFT_575582 [Xylariomycetidae sp. FL2044]
MVSSCGIGWSRGRRMPLGTILGSLLNDAATYTDNDISSGMDYQYQQRIESFCCKFFNPLLNIDLLSCYHCKRYTTMLTTTSISTQSRCSRVPPCLWKSKRPRTSTSRRYIRLREMMDDRTLNRGHHRPAGIGISSTNETTPSRPYLPLGYLSSADPCCR